MSKGTKQCCSFIGWVGADIEVSEKGDTVFGKLRIATDGGRVKDKQSGEYTQLTTWLDVTIFGNDAKYCRDYVKKGDQIAFDAMFKNNEWTTQEGDKRYDLDIIGRNIMKLGKREKSDPSNEPLADIA